MPDNVTNNHVWTDVLDSQPTTSHTKYLTVVLDEDGKQHHAVSAYVDGNYWIMYNLNWKQVTHWMELPYFPTISDELSAIYRVLEVQP